MTSRARIIDAAIELFGDRGVDRVSLRELTSHAGVNLASVNYHFGSKEGLANAVFETLANKVNTNRTSALQELVERREAQLTLSEIVEIFLDPYFDPEAHGEGELLAQMILRHRNAPTPVTLRIIERHFDPMASCFIDAIASISPHVDREEFYWRYIFMVSAIVLTITDNSSSNRLVRLSDGQADASDKAKLRDALTRFLVGGLQAGDSPVH